MALSLVPCRTSRGCGPIGEGRLLVEAKLVRSSRWNETDASSEGEPGEWQHGWQYWSSSVSDAHFRERTMLAGRTAARRAHLHSHSGGNAGVALAHCPTAPEFTIPPHLPDVIARTTPAATPDHGSRVRRLPSSHGPVGSSPGFLHTKWSGEETSHCHGAQDCTGMCPTERLPP